MTDSIGQNGKGDKPRPFVIDRRQYDVEWDRIFGPINKLKLEDSGSIESV